MSILLAKQEEYKDKDMLAFMQKHILILILNLVCFSRIYIYELSTFTCFKECERAMRVPMLKPTSYIPCSIINPCNDKSLV